MGNYLDLLQERISVIFDSLQKKVVFFMEEPENRKIRYLLQQKDPRVRTDCRKYTDGEFPAYFDPRFPNYNINQFESGYFVCEGPIKNDCGSMQRFIKNLFFNDHCCIEHILVVGDPNQGEAQFHSYFTENGQYNEYTINIIKSQKVSTNIKHIKLAINYNEQEQRAKLINLYQITSMEDHNTAVLDNTDIEQLYKICTEIEPRNLVAHCAAGLGRSPTILFSFILFKKFTNIFTQSNEDIIKSIIEELNSLRKIRPAAIQKFQQLQQSIDLCISYKKFNWENSTERQKIDLTNVPKICIIGTFDTKGEDYTFIRKGIIDNGCDTLTINTGSFRPKVKFPIDIDVKTSLIEDSIDIDLIMQKGRPSTVAVIKNWLEENILKIYTIDPFHGMIGLGGTNGTEIVTAAMRKLQRTMPKVCVSTVAQHENWKYTQTAGIIMINPITDVDGINEVSIGIYTEAITSICNMSKSTLRNNCLSPAHSLSVSSANAEKIIAITMFGNTTPCVDECKKILEKHKFTELLIFHAVGTGGKNMEILVMNGEIHAVLDITTTEIADLVGGGVFSAGPNRLSAPGKKGIPHLIVPGCLDMINLADYEQAKKQFPGRTLKKCNENVTVMRTTKEENIKMANMIAEKANAAKKGTVAVLIPLKSLSLFDEENEWHDEIANNSLFQTLANKLNPQIPIVEMDTHINDPKFAEMAIDMMIKLIRNRLIQSCLIKHSRIIAPLINGDTDTTTTINFSRKRLRIA